MQTDPHIEEALETHPCYNEEAHRKYARMHIPVAPKCNIQCNYCSRKYDCCNESRPGVTSEVLTPRQASMKIGEVLEKIPELKVIGIAGPGDPLANEETFESLELIQKNYPQLTSCISTNGLALPESAERLFSLGVRFVTVTINADSTETGAQIYGSVLWKGKKYTGTEGAEILLRNQLDGIKKCCDLGMVVKANIVMIPGINTDIIPDLVNRLKSLGVYIINILPLIPVKGTVFGERRGPTPAERKELMDLCSLDARMMRHCRQCRADAIGLLGEDRSAEFSGCGYGKGDGCGPSENIPNMVKFESEKKFTAAVASDGGKNIDAGFGNAGRFLVYSCEKGDVTFLREVRVDSLNDEVSGRSHREHIENIVNLLDDCDIIIVKEIGDMPRRVIETRGKRIVLSSDAVRPILSSLM